MDVNYGVFAGYLRYNFAVRLRGVYAGIFIGSLRICYTVYRTVSRASAGQLTFGYGFEILRRSVTKVVPTTDRRAATSLCLTDFTGIGAGCT